MKTEPQNQSFRFSFYSILVILLFIIINLSRWYRLPTFIDIYYHLSVLQGFVKAGGYVGSSFWEYAPVGRVHIYPPFIHIAMLLFYKLGLPALLIAKFFEFTVFPLLLFVIWYVVNNLFYRRLAFFAVLVSSSCYSFYLSAGNLIPASLALIFGLLSFLSLEKKKRVAASILLAFSFYSHAGVPYFFVLSFIIYGLLNRKRLKSYLILILSSIVLSLPILIHQFNSLAYIDISQIRENFPVEINILIYLFAILGIFYALHKKGPYYFFISLTLAMVPFSLIYNYRYLSGIGIIGLILLSALAIDSLYEKINKIPAEKYKSRSYLLIYFIVIILLFFIFSASIYTYKGKVGFLPTNSTYSNLIRKQSIITRANELSVYYPKIWRETTTVIKDNFEKGDIIYANGAYVAGVVSVYSKHATSTAMLPEIKPYKKINPMEVSKIIVWFKKFDSKVDKDLLYLIKQYNLQLVSETEFLYIYKNPHAEAKEITKKAILPDWLLFVILFLMTALIIVERDR